MSKAYANLKIWLANQSVAIEPWSFSFLMIWLYLSRQTSHVAAQAPTASNLVTRWKTHFYDIDFKISVTITVLCCQGVRSTPELYGSVPSMGGLSESHSGETVGWDILLCPSESFSCVAYKVPQLGSLSQ